MTDAQRTHLAVTIRRLEEVLIEIENTLAPGSGQRNMTVFEDDIAPGSRAAVLREIKRLVGEVRNLRERYQIVAERLSNRRRFMAKLSLLSIDLEGCDSSRMAAYGAIGEDEGTALDGQINRLLQMVDNLRATIGNTV